MEKKASIIRRPAKRIIGFALALATLAGFTTIGSYATTATAATNERLFTYGMKDTRFSIKPFGEEYNPVWNIALSESVEEWNDAHPDVNITISEDSYNSVEFDNIARRGLYSKVCILTHCYFKISIKEGFKNADNDWIMKNGKFLLIHELGHALGLNDFNYTPNGEISAMSAKNNYGIPKVSMYDVSLLLMRLSAERNMEQHEIILASFGEFLTPVSRAFNGWQN